MKQRQEEDFGVDASPGRQRIDKWLWAARFFKTRSLAAQAIEGGKVRVGGDRVKPARELKPGDEVQVRAGELEWNVTVRAIAQRRGPASEAALLYAESEASRARRLTLIAMRKTGPQPIEPGRPTKRDRRIMERFRRGE